MPRLHIKFGILAIGLTLLFVEELGYSVALERYALKGEALPFFNGPISTIIRGARII